MATSHQHEGMKSFFPLLLTFLIGLLIAIFIGFGIETFHSSPKMPEYPQKYSAVTTPEGSTDAEFTKLQEKYSADMIIYRDSATRHNREVSIISLILAVVVSVLSLTLLKEMPIIGDGVLLGGIFTLVYSVGRAFDGDEPKVQFTVIGVALALVIGLVYQKFNKGARSLE